MYPVIRMVGQLLYHRNDPKLPVLGEHVSTHYCLPWDIDLWRELNNGRTLTLFDLGRIPLAMRVGLHTVLRREKWGMTVAGASIRYRRRIRMFERITMRSRTICWDARFFYLEQSMWKANGECANHILLRMAFTGDKGIVAPENVLAALDDATPCPITPDWIQAWIDADVSRPWPPMSSSSDL